MSKRRKIDCFNSDNVNIGDKVIRYNGNQKSVGIVTNKTPSGMIDVDLSGRTERFSKHGYKKKTDEFGFGCLKYYTEEEGKMIENRDKRLQLIREIKSCNIYDFRLEALESILEICKEENSK